MVHALGYLQSNRILNGHPQMNVDNYAYMEFVSEGFERLDMTPMLMSI